MPYDLPKILTLQHLAYQHKAKVLNNFAILPFRETLDDIRKQNTDGTILKAVTSSGELIGSVRGSARDGTLYIGKLMVRPEHQGKGLGGRLLREIETCCSQPRYDSLPVPRARETFRCTKRTDMYGFPAKSLRRVFS